METEHDRTYDEGPSQRPPTGLKRAASAPLNIPGSCLPTMDELSLQPPRWQFSIAAILLISSAMAAVLGLARWWSDAGGLYLAIPVTALPFAYLVEFALQRQTRQAKLDLRPGTVSLRAAGIALGAILPAAGGWIGLVEQSSWWSPIPHLMFLSYAYLERWWVDQPELFYAIFAIPSAAYLTLVAPEAFSIRRGLPVRSLVLLGIATATTLYWFAIGFPFALEYQTTSYLMGTIVANFACLVFLWGTWAVFRDRFSFPMMVGWNAFLFSWLFWLAYPWLGEYL